MFYFAVFAMLPRQGERYRLRLATHHSPAGTAVPRTSAYRRNSPSSQWEAVEEVSLSPWGIVAPCPPRQGQQGTVSRSGYAVLAPSCSPLRPTGDCTRNAVYAIVKLREKSQRTLSLLVTNFAANGDTLKKYFSNNVPNCEAPFEWKC